MHPVRPSVIIKDFPIRSIGHDQRAILNAMAIAAGPFCADWDARIQVGQGRAA